MAVDGAMTNAPLFHLGKSVGDGPILLVAIAKNNKRELESAEEGSLIEVFQCCEAIPWLPTPISRSTFWKVI